MSDLDDVHQKPEGGGDRRPAGLTPEQRRRRARIAAHVSWANTADRAARTAAGTKAFLDRFERQVDPDGTLPAEVRSVMAQHARKAYMLQLAERSAAARKDRGQGSTRKS
ncbi:hypothetical protein [Micromonospora gifhornensis]|uniref:hypothetical protein n=1 Tax=Micromonospora gifhornensis TaxID=84594 RepID=UPI001953F8DD|nr:hypothetical protein [Micromonospora gifhornensis]